MFSLKTIGKQKIWSNWAGNVSASFEQFFTPTSIEELQTIVVRANEENKGIRVIGASHSFSPIAKPEDYLISLHHLRGLVEVDTDKQEATFWAGTYLHEIGPILKDYGLALENMGDIQEQTIAGAISTGTHGTGITLGSVSNQVIQWEWIDGTGQLHTHKRQDEDDLSNALHVSLGLLGIFIKITIKAVPLYSLKVTTYQDTLTEGLSILETKLSQLRHLEWFWFPGTDLIQVKEMDAVEPTPQRKLEKTYSRLSKQLIENNAFYFISEICRRHPQKTAWASRFSAKSIPSRTEVGYSYEMFASPRLVKFYEMEYAIPIASFSDCIRELESGLNRRHFHVHFPIECRFVKSETGFLSPNHHQDSAYLAFHMYKGMPYEDYFSWVNEVMAHFGGRPHWGKMNPLTSETASLLYPKWTSFQTIREQFDPDGIYLNQYLRELFASPW